MKNYQISFSYADLPYVMEAITMRALTLQQSIQDQIVASDQEDIKRREEERRAALPDPFAEEFEIKDTEIIITSDEIKPEKPAVSRKQKRAALMRILKSKGSADLSTAEIARRAGVSYVTAHKARAAFAPKKGRK